MRLLKNLVIYSRIPYLYLIGVLKYKKSQYHLAEIAFKRLLYFRPDHFKAHLYLGMIYIFQDEYVAAIQAFCRAKQINEKKFKKYNIPLPAVENLPEDSGELIWNYEDFIYQFEKEKQGYLECNEGGMEPPNEAEKRNMKGRVKLFQSSDFSSFQEFKKFQSLPPITPEDIHNIDWKKLLKDLTPLERDS